MVMKLLGRTFFVAVATLACTDSLAGPPDFLAATTCSRTVNVVNVTGFRSAIANAAPGDCINVAPGTYNMGAVHLTVNRSGLAEKPITIRGGGASTTIINMGVPARVIFTADYVHVRKLRFTNMGGMGVWMAGAHHNVLDSVEIDHTTQGAIRFRDASHHNIVQNSRCHDTGTVYPYLGECIYVGNSGSNTNDPVQTTNTDNQILNNHFGPNVRAQAVDVKPGSVRTVIRGNTIDGTGAQFWPTKGSAFLIAVAASYAIIENNRLSKGNIHGMAFFQQYYPLAGVRVANNTVDVQNVHNVTDRPRYGFNVGISSPKPSMVTIQCNNTVTNGRFSNMACIP